MVILPIVPSPLRFLEVVVVGGGCNETTASSRHLGTTSRKTNGSASSITSIIETTRIVDNDHIIENRSQSMEW